MNRHEGVSCDSCLKNNFRGRRYKCLICIDYDLCAACYESGATTNQHTTEHPMQCILSRTDFDLYYGGETLTLEQPQAYTCPFCNRMGFTDAALMEHVTAEHADTTLAVVCPVCASMPGGEPNFVTDDFAGHLTLEHRTGPRDLISFLDEPSGIRHGGVRRMPPSGRGVSRARRNNMQFSVHVHQHVVQHERRHLVAFAVVARRGRRPHRGTAVTAVGRAARRAARHAEPTAAATDAAAARAAASQRGAPAAGAASATAGGRVRRQRAAARAATRRAPRAAARRTRLAVPPRRLPRRNERHGRRGGGVPRRATARPDAVVAGSRRARTSAPRAPCALRAARPRARPRAHRARHAARASRTAAAARQAAAAHQGTSASRPARRAHAAAPRLTAAPLAGSAGRAGGGGGAQVGLPARRAAHGPRSVKLFNVRSLPWGHTNGKRRLISR